MESPNAKSEITDTDDMLNLKITSNRITGT